MSCVLVYHRCVATFLARLRDPTKNEARLLKLKDWPPGDDFSEKLPKRWALHYVCASLSCVL